MTASKIVAAAASGVGGAGPDVDEVFSTYLYTGTGDVDHTITNNIDLSGEGGMVWIKDRSAGTSGTGWHMVHDTERGPFKMIHTQDISAQYNGSPTRGISAFNSDGFVVREPYHGTISGNDYVSWTWRKAPKFFDVVTWTGNGTSVRQISHNLGSVPGMITIKRTSAVSAWYTWHRSRPTAYLVLDEADAEDTSNARYYFGDSTNVVAPTSTEFTTQAMNENGFTYVAYLFAHNDSGDGGFGPSGDQDIIKCGSYTGNGSTTGPVVNVGFEPQWLMIKRASNSEDWMLFDAMRGVPTGGVGNDLRANDYSSENSSINFIDFNSTGFQPQYAGAHVNTSGDTYIYMAIRRGPLAAPDDATKVFGVKASTNGSGTLPLDIIPTIGFAPDWGFVIRNIINGSRGGTTPYIGTRLTGYGKSLLTDRTNAEGTATIYDFATSDAPLVGDAGGANDSGAQNIHWLWKRAPSFCDVVCYSGTGSNRTVSHNLGVAPEMMWIKRRDDTGYWSVYHKGLNGGSSPENYHLLLHDINAQASASTVFNDTAPTSSVFSVGTHNRVNNSSGTYIAFLFATASGVSKVGSYTGNGSSQNIDCGFSSGARFVLIKNYSHSDNWMVYDSVRGIVSGNDPYLRINTAAAEYTTGDHIDPYSGGFAVTSSDPSTNANGNTYIFYAIA